MTENGKKYITSMRRRALVAVSAIMIGFLIVILSLTNVSLVRHSEYSAQADTQQLRDTVVEAKRGTIYDTNMNVLAESATVWTVAISPNDIKEADRETIASGLAEILGVDRETILEKCELNSYYSEIKRKVDQPVVQEIKQFMSDNNLSGIQFVEDSKRYYPYGNFLAQVLGFVGDENYGLAGLELYYNDELSGSAGRVLTAQNAVGSNMYYEYETIYEPESGYSLVLTVDEVVQHYLEKSLENAIEEHNVQNNAMGIVMNVKTGEIYALAVKPDFDPNNYLEIYDDAAKERLAQYEGTDEYSTQVYIEQNRQWRNSAISDLYEPGSVFKVITASAALETGAASVDSSYYCSGSVQVGPYLMYCSNHNGHGAESFVQATINSCNPAFIAIGQSIGVSNFSKYFQGFGLTEKTGIDLPGEASSIYVHEEDMGIVELSSCAFGQSNKITPLQMITAVAAAVNGGNLVQPHVVRQIIDEDGNIIKSYDTEIKRQVISEETSEQIASIMEQVVMHANGANAYVAGFRIGGKSGTAQDLTSDDDGKYWASFVGIAPADDPEIAILIVLDNARSEKSIYGGILVAPIVGSLMKNILPYIGVDAVYTEEELETADVQTPYVIDRTLTSAYAYLQPLGLSATVVGEGTTVVAQYPASGQSIPRGSSVMLYTDSTEMRTVSVPDVLGDSIDTATAKLKAVGLNIRVSGNTSNSAKASSQDAQSGTELIAGSVVNVEFVSSSVSE